jgi:hypothetical protein
MVWILSFLSLKKFASGQMSAKPLKWIHLDWMTGWPDSATFGDCLLWVGFLKITIRRYCQIYILGF